MKKKEEKTNYLPKKKSDVQLSGTIKFDQELWKNINVIEVQREFDDRFDDIKRLYDELLEEFKWNKLVYESSVSFNPVIGNTYHLYERENGTRFLSLIDPYHWDEKKCLGSFKLKQNKKWEKVQLIITKD